MGFGWCARLLAVLKHWVARATCGKRVRDSFSGNPQGETWRHLVTMADFTDR
jgi:hypothetical protein